MGLNSCLSECSNCLGPWSLYYYLLQARNRRPKCHSPHSITHALASDTSSSECNTVSTVKCFGLTSASYIVCKKSASVVLQGNQSGQPPTCKMAHITHARAGLIRASGTWPRGPDATRSPRSWRCCHDRATSAGAHVSVYGQQETTMTGAQTHDVYHVPSSPASLFLPLNPRRQGRTARWRRGTVRARSAQSTPRRRPHNRACVQTLREALWKDITYYESLNGYPFCALVIRRRPLRNVREGTYRATHGSPAPLQK